MEWNPQDVIDFKLGAVYENQNITSLKLTSQLLTPFVGWKRTSLNAGYIFNPHIFFFLINPLNNFNNFI
mgnify:CR=1 FL=1